MATRFQSRSAAANIVPHGLTSAQMLPVKAETGQSHPEDDPDHRRGEVAIGILVADKAGRHRHRKDDERNELRDHAHRGMQDQLPNGITLQVETSVEAAARCAATDKQPDDNEGDDDGGCRAE